MSDPEPSVVPPEEGMSHFRRIFGNPFLGFIGTLASVIGLGLAVYLYLTGQQHRDLVFTVHPARTILAQGLQTGKLKVEFRGSQVQSDVVGVRVALWNQGKGSIRSSNVLSPIQIRITPTVSILEATVIKVSRDVAGLRVIDNSDAFRKGELELAFSILEEGDGGSVQVIYAGSPEAVVDVVGVIEGQRAPRNLRGRSILANPEREYEMSRARERRLRLFSDGLAVVIVIGAGLHAFLLRHFIRRRPLPWGTLLLSLVVYLGAMAVCVQTFFFRYNDPSPPFGF